MSTKKKLRRARKEALPAPPIFIRVRPGDRRKIVAAASAARQSVQAWALAALLAAADD